MELKDAKRIVVKVGTSTLTHESGNIHIRRFEQLVKVLADICNAGRQVVLVSSGAIAVGAGKMGLSERPKDTPSKQALAAVGQCELMYLYDKAFSEYNHTVAQVLLTRDVMEQAHRKGYCQDTFTRLLEMGTIPIVNENDTLAVEEIEFGDNDTLSAVVAALVGADMLVILSDIEGLYTADPHRSPDAQLVRQVWADDPLLDQMAGGAGSRRGTGGMVTKVSAARLAAQHGIDTYLLSGADPRNLYTLLDGGEIGTRFTAQPLA
jgi:glutamate 5-kinase